MAARLGGEPGGARRLESSRHGYFRPLFRSGAVLSEGCNLRSVLKNREVYTSVLVKPRERVSHLRYTGVLCG